MAYATFHGSTPAGQPDPDGSYGPLVGCIAFNPATGQPIRAYDSYSALDAIIRNTDYPDTCTTDCLRPVGLALLDDRVLFSSDVTGEIYILVKTASTSSGPSKITRVAIGVSVALVVVLLILAGCIYWRWKRSRQLLGVHTSGDRGPDSMRLGTDHRDPSAVAKDDGLELASRRSWGRTPSVRHGFQEGPTSRRASEN